MSALTVTSDVIYEVLDCKCEFCESWISLHYCTIAPDNGTFLLLHKFCLTTAHFTTAQMAFDNGTFIADYCIICVQLHSSANPALTVTSR